MNAARTLSLALWLSAATPLVAQSDLPRGAAGELVTTQFTVEAIDQAARLVTLKAADGSVRTIRAGPDVKNLAQVKVGDVVKTTYVQAIALELKRGGSGIRSSSAAESSSSARRGEKPAGTAERRVTLVGTVEDIHSGAQLVTVKGPKGNLVDVAVTDPATLKQIRIGDEVELTYVEALAIAVSTPGKK